MQIKVKQDGKKKKDQEQLVSLPKAAEPLFSTVALPIWIADYYSQGDGWKSPDDNHRHTLQEICSRVYGEGLALEITENSKAWKKVRVITMISTDLLVIFWQGMYETVGLSQPNEE